MPAGRPRKDSNKAPKLGPPPLRVDRRSEEYYLERALQTPGLLTGNDYLNALQRLAMLRNGVTQEDSVGIMTDRQGDKPSAKLRRILGTDAVNDSAEASVEHSADIE